MSIRDFIGNTIIAGAIIFFVGLWLVWLFTPPFPYPAAIMLPNILWNLWLMIIGTILYILGIFLGIAGLFLSLTEDENNG